MPRLLVSALAALFLSLGASAQPVDSESGRSDPNRALDRRDLRLGIGAGTTGEAEASLTVRSRLLGPLSARLGGSLGLTEYGEPLVGGFALGLGIEQQRGNVSTSLWVTGWRQTAEGPIGSLATGGSDRPTLANMLSLGTEMSIGFDAPVGYYAGLRAYIWDERTEGTVGGVARMGARIRI